MSRIISIAIAAVLVFTLLSGCSGDASEPARRAGNVPAGESPRGAVKIKYVVPGVESRDHMEVMAAVNRKLADDGIGVEVEQRFIPPDVWEQKINLMLSMGEEFDLFHIMQDRVPFSTYMGKGALADITASVEKYGSHLKKAIPQDMWDGAQAEGKTYTVPTYWVEMASEGQFDIRLDMLRQNHLDVPRTPEQLLQTMQVVMNNWKGKRKPYLPVKGDFDPIAVHTTVLHRAYDSFPFTVKDKLFYVNQSGDVLSWIETPEFRKDAEFMRKAYTMGLLHPDLLVMKQEQVKAQLDSGEWFVYFGTGGSLGALRKVNPAAVNTDVDAVYFRPEKPYLRPLTIKNSNAVPVTSKHADEAVRFLDWIYASQDNYDLIQYGFEGRHYTTDGERDVQKLKGYSGSETQLGNIHFIRTNKVSGLPANNRVLYQPNDQAQNSVAANFIFDPTPVKAEYANVMSEAAASVTPIYMGVLAYDEAFPAALDRMKSAGLDRVVAEYVRQFREWRGASGKSSIEGRDSQ
ncbi:hypothetical protein PAESOLCIP111_02495 [Paenibacillus solanacearum]|uniref:DUF3502 domain-containing protein n=1 Tax=Paenibacillus solanacearum TaxID=2048548 RepID=A0A916K0S6_9BACL|nr:extracellular solute-binding protein [Paenibacillus solanacearum]CAG7623208.1 hypothetical protein PAESOLCIP111_02495 [Paenibacillus solanacearum]